MSSRRMRRATRNLQVWPSKLNPAETVIVGIGNALKGDDGAGPRICQILKDKIDAKVIDAGLTPENYISKIVQMSPKKLLVIDATDFRAPPGTVKILDIQDLQQFSFSTHCLSPHLFVEAIQLEINVEVIFIGVQPAHLQLERDLSKQVAGAIAALADEIKLALC